ncbi:undecaprenyl phosphate N,N'-diacetylbacillosamine 1-phosphate transferase [Ekhidna lutea]|uniref:Undecaprenyl phosphate N,N'-diacetylbacillosamine 1-phosphate transferase n=1 Tax=Ekhidna lutea TaxID=447679 RepID=A0A239HTI9_EKHLU|nr:sugar transferase [Ekhidna lutea]SNS83564.1 undecaprenyl phosphate N,N'-diacetylbacillosamine 1-phosphate transferase [Ekhidna lutea]
MPIFKAMRGGKFYLNVVKPLGDRVVAFILFIILLPVIFILSLIITSHFYGNPLFSQKRPGKEEHLFSVIKFRTMKVEGDESSTSRLGKFLRSCSLDELPQLINVLRGEMSIVGPRPLLKEYLSFYNSAEKKRHLVKPGITGWAQVNGRNQIDWAKRMKFDLYYVENVSFWLDCKILCKTIIEVLKRDKATYKNERTVKFSDYASKR